MTSDVIEVCRYLRDVLAFRNYIEVPEDKESYFTISDEELRTGLLRMDEHRLRLLESWCPKKKYGDKGRTADIILIPKVVSDIVPQYTSPRTKSRTSVWEYRKVSLLYIKAEFNLDTLRIEGKDEETLIWADPIIKCGGSGYLDLLRDLMGKMLSKWNDRRKLPRFRLDDALFDAGDGSWDQYMEGVEKHFEGRTGLPFFNSDSLCDEHGVTHSLYREEGKRETIVIKDDTVLATKNLESLLAEIEEVPRFYVPLFVKMILGNRKRKRLSTHRIGWELSRHLGQMKDVFPLADAQRDVLHCFSSLEEGDVLAVSGPPGTGKTTMLQSIVADMVVKSVKGHCIGSRWRRERPSSAPLILASSANNKAITNIIDAFSDDVEDTSRVDMSHRWLCYDTETGERFVPMAVYCPSAYAGRKNSQKYFTTDQRGEGSYGLLRKKYADDSSDFYRRATTALGVSCATHYDVMAALKGWIIKTFREIERIEAASGRRNASPDSIREQIARLLGSYESRESVGRMADDFTALPQSAEAGREFLDRLLDLTLRFDLYWLAVHYNECVWVKKMEDARRKNDEDGPRAVYGKFLWEEIKYICPCVIATFYRAPLLFEYKAKDGQKRYNFGLADLLIVDEAGQVSPEIGLPAFSLAKKALVVGDVNQIPPVHSIPEVTEDRYWVDRIKSRKSRGERRLLSCYCSNVMSIAESRCGFERRTVSGDKAPGLFLNEHRRCADEIIEYSNVLIYQGELLPRRGKAADVCRITDLPPIGFCTVVGESETKGGSRFNRNEVRAISDWLRRNAGRIEAAYSSPDRKRTIQELVCIITPFKAQSTLIKENDYLKGFPSGTVHTFQGAESPIVIFSLVYGEKDNPVFIKSNHELMNVAVSRAKDHFLVFGSRESLESNIEDEACGLLLSMSLPIPTPSQE